MLDGNAAVKLFLEVCEFQKWDANKIEETDKRTPDYQVVTPSGGFIAEVKQLNAEGYKTGQVFSYTPATRVRNAIGKAKGQLQNHDIPTMLVICDVRRVGYTRFEFMTAGMYGDLTMSINKKTGQSSEIFCGRSAKMNEDINTSISAVADICYDCSNTPLKPHINIYHNMYAKKPFERGFFKDGGGIAQYWFTAEENFESSRLKMRSLDCARDDNVRELKDE